MEVLLLGVIFNEGRDGKKLSRHVTLLDIEKLWDTENIPLSAENMSLGCSEFPGLLLCPLSSEAGCSEGLDSSGSCMGQEGMCCLARLQCEPCLLKPTGSHIAWLPSQQVYVAHTHAQVILLQTVPKGEYDGE